MLLIIFMVIVPVIPHGLASQMPQPSNAAQPCLGPVSVRVLATKGEPRYDVDGRAVSSAQLSDALLTSLRLRPERTVHVIASRQLSYREVAYVVGVAKAAGATAIALGRL